MNGGKIIAGLGEALAHARGEVTGARIHTRPAVWPPHRPVNALPPLPARPLNHVPAWAAESHRPPGEMPLAVIIVLVALLSLLFILAAIGASVVISGEWSGWAA